MDFLRYVVGVGLLCSSMLIVAVVAHCALRRQSRRAAKCALNSPTLEQ
ncbi:hypothetical protein KIH31_09255 [Paenarthrobacter sp. DKR-5]|nr:hypothetical protein [Paenarthrobacter sp. DKR-5]MBT1002792.1 hypothetical protein [Paenarthrobacter sp. DKR-5]